MMHGFGGAVYGHGADISLNGANPKGLDGTDQWFVFALSGTGYLIYLTGLLILAYRKWRKPWWFGVALAAGTVHQVGFFFDLVSVTTTGSVFNGQNGSDPFHGGAILWNERPLPTVDLPWREIAFAPGWPSFLIMAILIITLAMWVYLSWVLAGATNIQRSLSALLVGFVVLCLFAFLTSGTYAALSEAFYESTSRNWSATPILVLGILLSSVPVIVWVLGDRFLGWRSALTASNRHKRAR